MLKTIFSKVMWVGRATVFLVGLVVVLGLALAIVADAAEARVPALKKGVENAVSAVTSMAGALADPILRLDNNGTGPALDLQVQPGEAPLTVSEGSGTATNLDADKLDGKDASEFAHATRVVAFNGQVQPIEGNSSNFVFGGPTSQVTIGGNDRLTGAATATLGRSSGSPSQIAGIDLCYQSTLAGSPVNNFTGFDFVNPPIISTPQSYSASSTVSPGAGTYNVGFCVKNNGTTQISGVVNGWVMVTNDP